MTTLFRTALSRAGWLCCASGCAVAIALLFQPQLGQAQTAIESTSPMPASNPAISFRRPLRVSSVRIPNDLALRRSRYLFTFDFPADAVEPLERLVFEQVEGVDYPRYRGDDSYAFKTESGERLPLSAVENNSGERSIAVVFDPPVEPGEQVTVALSARNPRDGIYIYQLTAFPAGASVGQYAGVERLNFYRPRRRDRFFHR